jgi:hypothetical protein
MFCCLLKQLGEILNSAKAAMRKDFMLPEECTGTKSLFTYDFATSTL